jgi:aerobic carbon-monoxide dehydrogenase small subunit
MLLVHYIREVVGTGTHVGCESTLAEPARCSWMQGGQVVHDTRAQADGATVTTVEGLARDGAYHPLQQGFWEEHGS